MSESVQKPASENWLVASGAVDPLTPFTLLQLDSGRIVSVPTSLLLEPVSQDAFLSSPADSMTIIPVLEEELVIAKRTVPLETLRIEKSVETVPARAEVQLTSERFEVTRVPVLQEVEARSAPYRDGDTDIFPIFEERLMTRTALFLVEEVRVKTLIEKRTEVVEAVLNREKVSLSRSQPS